MNDKNEPVRAFITAFALNPIPGAEQRRLIASSDEIGRFQFTDLTPGEYRVFAWEDPDPGLTEIPQIRRAFESSSVKIDVPEKGAASVKLSMILRSAMEAEKVKLP
jgi:hypothetical protein